jgi:hypothetical protein
MVLVMFTVRLRDDIDHHAFRVVSARMMELVTRMLGFRWFEWYASSDGPDTHLAPALRSEMSGLALKWRKRGHATGLLRRERASDTRRWDG